MDLISKLELNLKEVLEKLGYIDDVKLNVSNRPDLGDYQYNGAFKLARVYKKSPIQIADEIISVLSDNSNFKNISNANGFINFSLSDECLINYVNQVIDNFNINTYKEEEKTIFLDYGGANVAKTLHAGHLRSANIGEALKRLCEAVGHKTISDVHLGDWGRPMGLIILEISKRYPNLPFFDKDYEGVYPECPVTL